MSGATVDGWTAAHGRHRSLHRRRLHELAAATRALDDDPPARGVPEDRDDRTWKQRVSDAFPMGMVSGICFGLGLSLRASDANGPAPALPIWTLFLALGCIAALGAGASWVVGGSTPPPSPLSSSRGISSSRRLPPRPPRASPPALHLGPEAMGNPVDDTLPAVNWAPEIPTVARTSSRRTAESTPAEDPMPDLPGAAPIEGASSHQVMEEIDRLATDLKPVPPRARPVG